MSLSFIISSLFFLPGLIIIYWIHNQNHHDIGVSPAPLSFNVPLISICVPARNEEHNLRPCIEAILAQTYPSFEVIVLDDLSTDATPAILKELSTDLRVHPVNGSNLPAGWASKPHALHQASHSARGHR